MHDGWRLPVLASAQPSPLVLSRQWLEIDIAPASDYGSKGWGFESLRAHLRGRMRRTETPPSFPPSPSSPSFDGA